MDQLKETLEQCQERLNINNMKTYRLQKAYPGSFEVGTEVKWGNNGLSGECYEARIKAGIFRFRKDIIENNPEFWQEVVKPEFQILSFTYGFLPGLISYEVISDESLFQAKGSIFRQRTAEQLLEEGHKIHSVRRLSDGLVITVGDNVVIENTLTSKIVTGFRINNDKTAFKKGLWITIKNGGIHLERVKEICAQPLFVTEDGVKIFKGSTYWCVNTAPHLWSLFEQTAKERTQLNKTVKAFSTEHSAQRYIARNQPRLSIEDCIKIRDMWSSNRVGLEETILGYLIRNGK